MQDAEGGKDGDARSSGPEQKSRRDALAAAVVLSQAVCSLFDLLSHDIRNLCDDCGDVVAVRTVARRGLALPAVVGHLQQLAHALFTQQQHTPRDREEM